VRLRQVVSNLLSNAAKYSSPSAVVAALRSVGDTVEVEIVDKGVGIPAVDLPNVFQRFRRASGASDSGTGTGVGLFVVESLTRAMGGTVTVNSQVGQGSRFTVSLPAATEADLEPVPASTSMLAISLPVGWSDAARATL
jgi:signal transduction histidine kinase